MGVISERDEYLTPRVVGEVDSSGELEIREGNGLVNRKEAAKLIWDLKRAFKFSWNECHQLAVGGPPIFADPKESL